MAVITISRQFGAGGKTLGERLSKRLGYRYAEDALNKEVAKKVCVSSQQVRTQEKRRTSMLMRLLDKIVSPDYIDRRHVSGTFVYPPSIEGRVKTSSGKEFLRVKFRLWPGRGTPIETVFKQEVFYSLKALDPNYQDWMVTVNYEVERKPVSLG